MKATAIPQKSRDLVRARSRGRCDRCLVPSPTGHWHHRRSRKVRDEHTHCACNGVWLCPMCHEAVHSRPEAARQSGWVVSRDADPFTIPFKTPTGWMQPDCGGGWRVAL